MKLIPRQTLRSEHYRRAADLAEALENVNSFLSGFVPQYFRHVCAAEQAVILQMGRAMIIEADALLPRRRRSPDSVRSTSPRQRS